MEKKLTKHGNSLALVIDKPILQLLGINEKSNLEISVSDGVLIIKPMTKRSKRSKKNDSEIDKIADRVMDKYEAMFKKLAKT